MLHEASLLQGINQSIVGPSKSVINEPSNPGQVTEREQGVGGLQLETLVAQSNNSVEAQYHEILSEDTENSVDLNNQNNSRPTSEMHFFEKPTEEENRELIDSGAQEVTNMQNNSSTMEAPFDRGNINHQICLHPNSISNICEEREVGNSRENSNIQSAEGNQVTILKRIVGQPVKGKESQRKKGDSKKEISGKNSWVDFAQGMLSNEDVRIFNNDMRNRNCRIVEADMECPDSEPRRVWDFGKKIGLVGDDQTIESSLRKLDDQVRFPNQEGKEISENIF